MKLYPINLVSTISFKKLLYVAILTGFLIFGTITIPRTIGITLSACKVGKSPFKTGDITTKGTANGYMTLEIESSKDIWKLDSSSGFTAPSKNYTVNFPNDEGYNTKKWKLNLYSGGTKIVDKWSGGTEKATNTGNPTGCT